MLRIASLDFFIIWAGTKKVDQRIGIISQKKDFNSL